MKELCNNYIPVVQVGLLPAHTTRSFSRGLVCELLRGIKAWHKIAQSLMVHCKAIFIPILTVVAAFDVNLECKGGHAVQRKQQMSAGQRSCFEKRS